MLRLGQIPQPHQGKFLLDKDPLAGPGGATEARGQQAKSCNEADAGWEVWWQEAW